MATVRDVTRNLLRELYMTTIFGNPGSTELPMLRDFPEDFRYILALHEASALGMAEGYARATGNAALVNLHTAPGLGNAMGAMVTAFHNKTPLVVTAGQQHRDHIALEPLLTGKLVELAKPYVKRSHEPLRAEDVPGEILRAYHTAMTPPCGPVFVSIPMDDWDAEAEGVEAREVSHKLSPDPEALRKAADILRDSRNPAIVVGPGVARSRSFREVVALAEALRAPVFQEGVSPLAGFPQNHPLFGGFMPLAQKPVAEKLSPYDAILVLGTQVFTYYPYVPGPIVEGGAKIVHITDDPEEAAAAPVGTSVVGDVALAAGSLFEMLPEANRPMPPAPEPPPKPEATSPMSVDFALHALAELLPEDVVVSDESTSSKAKLHKYIKVDDPLGYITSAAGGLGFCMPAAVGAKLALPDRPVVCVIGDGSSMYSIQSLWTAARYRLPVAFIVINNGGYSILKSFRNLLGMEGVPGLDVPDADLVKIANGFGVEGERVESPDELRAAIKRALSSERPYLVDIMVDTAVPELLG
ncbi:MAG: benzoylformate decarboxylase [Rubrobacter sp.]|jgi:benzoylformate decarboxylase|nr:benzoylformate decarboxylase [Rubrobacter sp.]